MILRAQKKEGEKKGTRKDILVLIQEASSVLQTKSDESQVSQVSLP